MKYLLVDGHNLIGQVPGLKLSDQDDEGSLVMMLRRWAQAERGRSVIVVFDHGVYGHPGRLDGYGVTARFARSPQDADTQLIKQLRSISRPHEWTLVSSDRQVAQVAAECRVRVLNAHDFARTLIPKKPKPAASEKPTNHGTKIPDNEVAEWLTFFGISEEDADREDLQW